MATTVPPEIRQPWGLATRAPIPDLGCRANGKFYLDGEAVPSKDPCEHCYCMKHEVVCAIQECKAPCEGCVPIPSPTDKCCPERYECPAPTRSVPPVNVEGINETTTAKPASSESVSSEFHPVTEEPKAIPSTEVSPSTEGIESEGEATSPHPPDEAINVVDVASEVAHPPDREVEPSSSHSPPPLPLDEKKLEDVLGSSSSTEPPFVAPSSSESPSSSSEVPFSELAPSDEGKEDAKDTPPVEKVDEGEESNKIPHEAPSSPPPPSASGEEGGDHPQHEGGGHDKEPPSSTTTLSPFTSEGEIAVVIDGHDSCVNFRNS